MTIPAHTTHADTDSLVMYSVCLSIRDGGGRNFRDDIKYWEEFRGKSFKNWASEMLPW